MKYCKTFDPIDAIQVTKEHFDDHSLLPEWVRSKSNLRLPPQGNGEYVGQYTAPNNAEYKFEPGHYLHEQTGWGDHARKNYISATPKERFEDWYKPYTQDSDKENTEEEGTSKTTPSLNRSGIYRRAWFNRDSIVDAFKLRKDDMNDLDRLPNWVRDAKNIHLSKCITKELWMVRKCTFDKQQDEATVGSVDAEYFSKNYRKIGLELHGLKGQHYIVRYLRINGWCDGDYTVFQITEEFFHDIYKAPRWLSSAKVYISKPMLEGIIPDRCEEGCCNADVLFKPTDWITKRLSDGVMRVHTDEDFRDTYGEFTFRLLPDTNQETNA